MTDGVNQDPNTNDHARNAGKAVRDAFAALPCEQKIKTLIDIELDLVSDIAGTLVDATSQAARDLGRALDDLFRPAPRPSEPGGTV
ncbi:MAG TPA: hypothetical protein VNO70_11860 [Blastocatellia bacterium]|nr:hypothetical protein [Blastocatellia bacterium]